MKEEFNIQTYTLEKSIPHIEESKKNTEIIEDNGLRKGAYGIIFAYIALILYINPFSLDFIPYGLSIANTFIIPESIYFLIISVILSLVFSTMGVIISTIRLSLLGLFLSLIIFGNTFYLSSKAYGMYKKNPVIFEKLINNFNLEEVISKIKFIKKSDLNKSSKK